jgi:hypothetical protein
MDPNNENKAYQADNTSANIFQGDLNEEEEVIQQTGQSNDLGLNF